VQWSISSTGRSARTASETGLRQWQQAVCCVNGLQYDAYGIFLPSRLTLFHGRNSTRTTECSAATCNSSFVSLVSPNNDRRELENQQLLSRRSIKRRVGDFHNTKPSKLEVCSHNAGTSPTNSLEVDAEQREVSLLIFKLILGALCMCDC
jgi:hypothetical protein